MSLTNGLVNLNKISSFAIAALLLLPSILFAKYIAVLETLSPKDLLTRQERMYLTDILRGEAVRMLPAMQNWTIMTRENINVMLPPGKTIEDCEGSCLAETGKNIAADFVAQARISQFGNSLAITTELYETASSKLVASFTGKGENVEEIEKIIKEQAPNLFRKVRDNSWNGLEYINTNASFTFRGQKKHIVTIQTDPAGAIPTFDGKAIPQCTKTPCKIQIEAGEHRLIFSKERFDDLDTLVNINENGQVISAKLTPIVSYLKIATKIPGKFRKFGSPSIRINEKRATWGKNELMPGIYSVRLSHSCYDPLELNIALQKNETRIISDSLKRGIGGLELSVLMDGEPQAVPVFADGVQIGTTPFTGEVPLCSKIEIDNNGKREEIPANIKWHEVTRTTYKTKKATPVVVKKPEETRQKAEKAYAELDNKKPAPEPAKDTVPAPESKEPSPKRFWGGITAGLLYNDFYGTKFGLDDITHDNYFDVSVKYAEDLLSSYWGVGFKFGISGMYILSELFTLRGDLNIALRQGSGESNISVLLTEKETNEKNRADLEVEYSTTQLNIDLPLLARYSATSEFYAEMGPMFSFNVYSKSESKISDLYESETFEDKGGLSAFEFDIVMGLGVTKNISRSIIDIDLRFILGITRLSEGKHSPRTWQWQLNATYWFL